MAKRKNARKPPIKRLVLKLPAQKPNNNIECNKPTVISTLQRPIEEYDSEVEGSDEQDQLVSSSSSDEDLGSQADGNEDSELHVVDKAHTPVPQKRNKKDLVVQPKDITYVLNLFSAKEMLKISSKREAKTKSMTLSSTESWDSFQAQLLDGIDEIFKPATLDFALFDCTFFIPRNLPKPGLDLKSERDYALLIKRIQEMKSNNPMIYIIISTKLLASDMKENDRARLHGDGDDDDEGPPMKKKKVLKKDAVLPGNEKKLENIQALQDHWKCPKCQESCVGVHCYINPATSEHLPLSMERLDCWASAMLRGETHATLQTPPNHKLFDISSACAVSPVLQRRLDIQNAKVNTSSSPVINIHFPDGLVDLLRPGQNPVAPPPIVPGPGPAAAVSTVGNDMLLHPSRAPGFDLPIDRFCADYALGNKISEKLSENGYQHARVLRFVTITQLKDMGFKMGEIAGLQDAVESWSVIRVV